MANVKLVRRLSRHLLMYEICQMFHSSSNDPRNLFKSDNVYRYAAFACLDSTYSAKRSESDSSMALSECIYCLPGYLEIFGVYVLNIKKSVLIIYTRHLICFFFRTQTPDIDASDKKLSFNVPSWNAARWVPITHFLKYNFTAFSKMNGEWLLLS